MQEFCWFLHLNDPEIAASVPTDMNPSEFTDLLVSAYTEDDALSETVEILREMGRHVQAERLEEHFVDNHKDMLILRMRYNAPLLDELLIQGVIHEESYDKIRSLPTKMDQMRELFNFLRDAGVEGKVAFFDIIEKLDPDLLKNIEKNLQSEAGNFECSISGLRWVCKKKVSLQYQFGSWEKHTERLETMQYVPGGPLLDITLISGKLDEVYLPHWVCTKDNPAILGKFAVLHIDTCGDVVEQADKVTPSHVKLSHPAFSPRAVLVRAGLPLKIYCKVLICKTKKSFLTLHVYVIPRDPALQEAIKKNGTYTMIEKPYPQRALKMRSHFVLTANKDNAKIYPLDFKLTYQSSDPNYFEVYIKNPDSDFELTLTHESTTVWDCEIRKDDYDSPGDIQDRRVTCY
ncbi:hypothetical protein L3Q82_005776 [Scortum barcoo]|uniref:Uncharacterized protein n=1 Tax=Scortum barcoo TaxID=214431 RepID=A0ACB8V6B6_9TELE|nr:hypothetical protein L3Q82_005776 [Scortum barcoo]